MVLLETTEKYKVDTEQKAKEVMEAMREQASEKGYKIVKSGYQYKNKKLKGEIIAEAYIVTITKEFGTVWEDI